MTRARGLAGGIALFLLGTQLAVSAEKKGYRDPVFGVSFSYPATWSVDPLRDAPKAFGQAPQILSQLGAEERPLVRVGFTVAAGWSPYPHSTLEGVEFIVISVADRSTRSCKERLSSQGVTGRGTSQINGVQYEWVSSSEEAVNSYVDRRSYAAFREGRCFLYEEDIQQARSVVEDDVHILRPSEIEALHRELESAMESVRYLGTLR